MQLQNLSPGRLTAAGQSALSESRPTLARYGLALTPRQELKVVQGWQAAQTAHRRLETSGSLLTLLTTAFCDSPWLNNETLADTLCELCDIFYYFKNEWAEGLTDEELAGHMAAAFNRHGSLDLLRQRDLERMLWAARGVWESDDDRMDMEDYLYGDNLEG